MAEKRPSDEAPDLEEEFSGEDWDDIASDPEMASRLLRALDGIIPGIVKRATLQGVGNILLSEDGLRSILSENKKLPKEVVGLIVSQADSMRREILRIISREIRIFLENMDFGGEIAKILTSVSFEIKTEIRFIPNDQAVKPQVKNKVSARRVSDGSKIDLGEDDLGEGDEPEPPLDEPEAAGEEASAADEDDASEPPRERRPRKLRWGRRKRNGDASRDEDIE